MRWDLCFVRQPEKCLICADAWVPAAATLAKDCHLPRSYAEDAGVPGGPAYLQKRNPLPGGGGEAGQMCATGHATPGNT